MSITGLLPPTAQFLPYTDNIAAGPVQHFSGHGRRSAVSTATNGDDVWTGTATTLPIPPPAGQQMTVVSTSANDTAAGTGLRTVEIHYLDNNLVEKTELITMNGLVGVNTVAVNIRFVNDFYGESVGAAGAAVGTITIFAIGVPATVYTQIDPGHFRHANTARMVPAGFVCLVEGFAATGGAAAGGKSASITLRGTSHHGLLLPTNVFGSDSNILVFNSALFVKFDTPLQYPAGAIIKCTSFATAAGADVSAEWHGKLVTAPV